MKHIMYLTDSFKGARETHIAFTPDLKVHKSTSCHKNKYFEI